DRTSEGASLEAWIAPVGAYGQKRDSAPPVRRSSPLARPHRIAGPAVARGAAIAGRLRARVSFVSECPRHRPSDPRSAAHGEPRGTHLRTPSALASGSGEAGVAGDRRRRNQEPREDRVGTPGQFG